VKSLFTKYDKDGSGRLQKTEMMELLKVDLGLDDKQAETFLLLVDKDGSGSVSFDEFYTWIHDKNTLQNIDDKSRYHKIRKAIEMFKKYDKDASGSIDREEFKQLMHETGNKVNIDKALKKLDKDGNGQISFTEF
ncbi:predicted protein, partial [Nematostella vectensis]